MSRYLLLTALAVHGEILKYIFLPLGTVIFCPPKVYTVGVVPDKREKFEVRFVK
ncbi:hypothetical protein D3C86_1282940 [compost metagenome]